jgi:hypothetical protein
MADDTTRLVEQARELVALLASSPRRGGKATFIPVLAGLADAVEQLQAEEKEWRAALAESCDENRVNTIKESAWLACPAEEDAAAARGRVAELEAERDRLEQTLALMDEQVDQCQSDLVDMLADRDRLHALLWQFVTADQIPAARKDGTDRLLLDIDPALWGKAADAVGYDEQGQ